MNNMLTPIMNANIISVNVHGIRSYTKRQKVFNWLTRKNADIILLQEPYSTKEVERYWKQQWKGKMVFSHGTNHSKGVTILFNEKLDFEIKYSIVNQNGRFIILNIEIQGHPVILTNVYFPCASKPRKQELMWDNFRKFISEIDNYDDKSLFLGGDFNVLMNIHLDRDGGNPRYDERVLQKIECFMDDFDLVDIWRARNPHTRQYTWRQTNPLIQSRLDLWLVSNKLQDMIVDTGISPAISTDHSLVFIKIKDDNPDHNHGPSYWKFNNSLCDDIDFSNALCDIAPEWFRKYNDISDHRILWELIKFEIRLFTQALSKDKAVKKRN